MFSSWTAMTSSSPSRHSVSSFSLKWTVWIRIRSLPSSGSLLQSWSAPQPHPQPHPPSWKLRKRTNKKMTLEYYRPACSAKERNSILFYTQAVKNCNWLNSPFCCVAFWKQKSHISYFIFVLYVSLMEIRRLFFLEFKLLLLPLLISISVYGRELISSPHNFLWGMFHNGF